MCAVCFGHYGCPLCNEDPKTITCTNCNGSGNAPYEPHEDNIMTLEEWNAVPARHKDRCEVCSGEGEIIKPIYSLFYT